jgi:ArsR family transcriptional regulator
MVVPMRRRRLLQIAKQVLPHREGLPRVPHPLPLEVARVAQWFHAASDTTRIGILEFLSHKERCVSELQEILDTPQSRVSFHLRVLRESGLVRERREGRWKYYSLRGETLDYMIAFAQVVSPGKHAGTCALSCCQ